MAHPVDDLQRIGLKLFAESVQPPTACEFVPIFHRWIQTSAVAGLLIDVADYGHLVDGPSVVLVAHEVNYALDYSDGRMGLQCSRKQPIEAPLAARLTSLCRTLLKAGRLLEVETSLAGRLRFRGDEVQFVSNDRRLAPNTDETLAGLEAPVAELADRLFDGGPIKMTRTADPRERLMLTIKTTEEASLDELLARLG